MHIIRAIAGPMANTLLLAIPVNDSEREDENVIRLSLHSLTLLFQHGINSTPLVLRMSYLKTRD